MIAALFVQTDGAYFGLPDVDPWDEKRDARLYDGPHRVVAHPPCSRWCRLAGLVEKRWGHKKGDDGGCFASALEMRQRELDAVRGAARRSEERWLFDARRSLDLELEVKRLRAALQEIAVGKIASDNENPMGEGQSMAGRFLTIAQAALRTTSASPEKP